MMKKRMDISGNMGTAVRALFVILTMTILWGCESTAPKGGHLEKSALASLSANERVTYDRALADLAANQPERAEKQFSQLLRTRPDVAEVWLNLALSQYQQDAYEESAETLAGLLSRFDGIAQSYNLAGLLAVKRGEFEKAQTQYKKAIEIDAGYSNALFNMALLQDVYLQNVALAVEYYTRYLQEVPDDADTKNWTDGLRMSLEQ